MYVISKHQGNIIKNMNKDTRAINNCIELVSIKKNEPLYGFNRKYQMKLIKNLIDECFIPNNPTLELEIFKLIEETRTLIIKERKQ